MAAVDGLLVGWCPSGTHDDGRGWFWIGVDSACRRRGIGSAFYDRLERRLRGLGAPGLTTQTNDDDGQCFLVARGFERTDVTEVQALDLTSARLESAAIEGVRVLPLRCVREALLAHCSSGAIVRPESCRPVQ